MAKAFLQSWTYLDFQVLQVVIPFNLAESLAKIQSTNLVSISPITSFAASSSAESSFGIVYNLQG